MSERARLTITLAQDGTVGLEGPLDNKLVCYGLVESARDMIKDYHDAKARKEQPVIERPSPADVRSIATNGRNGHRN